jgi:GAF domain-containing protein
VNAVPIQPKRRVSLQTRVSLAIVILAVLVSTLTLTVVYFNFRSQLRDSLRQRLVSIVALAALQQDGDAFQNIQSSEDPEYVRVWAQNTAILNADSDLVFLYTMRFDDEGLYFVVDAGDPSGSGFSPYGTRNFEPGTVLLANYRTMQEPISENTFYKDEYGRFLSAYAPIRDHLGHVTGIIAADITANKIIASERRLLFISIGIFATIIPIIALLGLWLGSNLAGPIQALNMAATRIAQGELKYRPVITTRRIANSLVPEIKMLNQSFFSMADQQRDLIENLEERVATRTTDLSLASEQIKIRATQLQTIAEVAHSVSLVQDIEHLLSSIAKIIAERFGFYHIGIFLLDTTGEYAVLKATNSAGGQEMLAREHKLKVGEVGIVGYAAGSAKARIALDVGQDAIFFNNPDLPETRSEIALPLLVKGMVIGILDIQSREVAAFREEDINVFHILADQVAIAIENARLFSETKRALAEVEKSYSLFVQGGWSRFAQNKEITAIRYSAQENRILEGQPDYPEINKALETGQTIAETEKVSTLAIPLSIRGEIIGILDIRIPEKYDWNNKDINTVQRIADRASYALENARLYEETRSRGSKEQIISEISSKISTSINIRNVLQTAVEELGRALPGSDIEIRLEETKSKQ